MSELEFQTVLARLALDRAFLEWFKASGDMALADYNLSNAHKARLHALDFAGLAEYQASIVRKAWHRIRGVVTVPKGVEERELERLHRTYLGLRVPQPTEDIWDYAISFMGYAAANLEARTDASWVMAGELLRHRANWLEAYRKLRAVGRSPSKGPDHDLADGTSFRRYRLNPLVRIDKFSVRVLDPSPVPSRAPEWILYSAIGGVHMQRTYPAVAHVCLRASERPQPAIAESGDPAVDHLARLIRCLRRDRILIDA